MNRLISTVAASAASFLLFTATTVPAFAQSGAAYRLTPAAAVTASTLILDDTVWKCGAESCTASKSTSRPAIVCAKAAKKVGRLTSFSVKGEAFTDEELAKCNEKAR